MTVTDHEIPNEEQRPEQPPFVPFVKDFDITSMAARGINYSLQVRAADVVDGVKGKKLEQLAALKEEIARLTIVSDNYRHPDTTA